MWKYIISLVALLLIIGYSALMLLTCAWLSALPITAERLRGVQISAVLWLGAFVGAIGFAIVVIRRIVHLRKAK